MAGALSHPPLPMPTKYIGMLSRLSVLPTESFSYDLLFLLSGPEPQRSRLERLLLTQARGLDKKIMLVRGKTERKELWINEDGVEIANYLTSGELNRVLAKSRLIVCRPGYSSLMDLARLGKRVLLIPTPGQTEQEYLAEQLFRQGICHYQPQKELNLHEALTQEPEFEGFSQQNGDEVLLKKAVRRFLETCQAGRKE